MKKKTEEKKEEILKAAAETFRELGFEKTSMSEIRKRVGGSKATLYNYFESKDELFFESIFRSIEYEFEAVHNSLNINSDNIMQELHDFGVKLIAFLYAPDIFANRKLAITQSDRTELGKIVYEKGIIRSHFIIASFFEKAIQKKVIRSADPMMIAKYFIAILEAELLIPFLHGVKTEINDSEVNEIVTRAIAVFANGYCV